MAAGGGAAATTVVELETQSAAGNPNYLAVEQRSDEFAAKLLGLYDPPHSQRARFHQPSIRPPPTSASSATSRQTPWSVPMPNSPDLLTRALQNPTLLEAELGRRRARDGTDRDVLAWIEATFPGSAFPPWRAVKGTWRRRRPSVMPCPRPGRVVDCVTWLRGQDVPARAARGRQRHPV